MTIRIDHTERTALVTGAGAGIGREVALWLARAGAAVAVNDLRSDRAEAVATEIDREGGSAVPVVADCRDDAAVDAMVATVLDRLGGLDIAVNNVGMLPPGRSPQPFVQSRGEDWRDIIDQNLVTAALGGRAESDGMGEGGGRTGDGEVRNGR